MRKIIFLVCILTTVFANAQRVVKETFESNKFRWEEFYEKECSVSIQDGYLVLQNKVKELPVCTVTELPIAMDNDNWGNLVIKNNFKITFKLLVPKLNDEYWFGILYNYEDENNYSSFLVQEKKYRIYNKRNGTLSLSKQSQIILKSGKNKEVTVELQKKGNKLIFTVDNMEVETITKKLYSNSFGFYMEGSNTIKIDEVIIEQQGEE